MKLLTSSAHCQDLRHPDLRVQRYKEEKYPPNFLRNSEKYAIFAANLANSQNIILQETLKGETKKL